MTPPCAEVGNFPAAKCQAGETLQAALRRELHEELGIEAEIGAERYRTRHHYPGQYTVELIFFDVITFQGAPQNLVF